MPESSDNIQRVAKLVAMFLRDRIEDSECEHLSDDQMPILNRLIGDAIYTALYPMEHMAVDWRCGRMVDEKSRAHSDNNPAERSIRPSVTGACQMWG